MMPLKEEMKQSVVPQIKKDNSTLSKLQRQFNNKIKRIDKLKAQIAERTAMAEQVQKRVQQEVRPLSEQIIAARVEIVKLFDRAYSLPLFKKREREKLAFLIEDLSFQLIENFGKDELIPLHDKYASMSHAEAVKQAEAEEKEMAQSMFKNFFGVDVDLENPDDLDGIKEQVRQKMEEEEQGRQAKQASRKKTKAQLAKEEKMKAEMDNISKASRRIYTDLVKLLHPDREQDEELRARKEEVMKQLTTAYNQNDFFELLRLQMEYLQEKDKALDDLPEEQLKYYLKLLSEQVRELEVENINLTYGPDARLLHKFGGAPKQMEQKFRAAKSELKKELQQLKSELKDLEDPQVLRNFLKEIK